MITSAFVGFYNLPLTKRIRPKFHSMSMEKLTLNVMCVLLLSSSFPVVARILGIYLIFSIFSIFSVFDKDLFNVYYCTNVEITSFDLLGDYSNTTYLRSNQFLYLYKLVFVVALTHRYVTFFNASLHDILVNFMTPILMKYRSTFGNHPLNTNLLDIHSPKRKNE